MKFNKYTYIVLIIFLITLGGCGLWRKIFPPDIPPSPDTGNFTGLIYINNKHILNCKAYINIDNEAKDLQISKEIFYININLSKNHRLTIKLFETDSHYGIDSTFMIPAGTNEFKFELFPAPKSIENYKELVASIDSSLNLAKKKLEVLKKMRDETDDPLLKKDLDVIIRARESIIKDIDSKLIKFKKELEPLEPYIINKSLDISKISILSDINKGFEKLNKTAGNTYNFLDFFSKLPKPYKVEFITKTFWKPTEYKLNQLKGKTELIKFVSDIKKYRNDEFQDYENKQLTVYIHVECSADKSSTSYRTSAYNNAIRDLRNENVEVFDKDYSSDTPNYQLALLRGYTLFKYVYDKHNCSTCKMRLSITNHGSQLNQDNPNGNKADYRFAKISYWIMPE